jgi:hypothetical protein
VSIVETERKRFGGRADLVAPQAARPCNPFQSNFREAEGYAGFSWYLGDDVERPEAASFGDALAEIELFATSLARPFVLAGRGQGAVLAMTLALHAPPSLAGVWCEGAALVQLDGWTLPEAPLSGIPFALCLDDLRFTRARDVLEARGARIEDGGIGPEDWLRTIGLQSAAK